MCAPIAVTWLFHLCDITQLNMCAPIAIKCVCTSALRLRIIRTLQHTMGWLPLVGSSKIQVSFAKEPYKRDDILQKRPMISTSLLIVATPYNTLQHIATHCDTLQHTRICRGALAFNCVLQCVAVCCSVLQCVAVCCSVLPCVADHQHFIMYWTWLIHLCDMTHSSVWHDSCICVTWPIHLCDMTHSSV